MHLHDGLESIVKSLFESQRFAVLATDDQGQPHTSLMAFAASDDLKQLIVATKRGTRKYANLKSNRRVALLVDNRANEASDVHKAVAVTVVGQAQEIDGDEGARLSELYLDRHPYLTEFTRSPACALVQVQVESYQIVTQISKIVTWCPES